jgi:hypothetical protein
MADITYNPVAGVPFSGSLVMKDMTGAGGPYAPISLGIAGFLPVLSLSAVTAASTAGAVLDNQGVRNNHSLMVITSGTVTSGTLQLQGSQDNVNWVNLLGGSGFQQGLISPVSGTSTTWLGTAQLTPFRYLRGFIVSTIGGGGNISAYVASAG